MSARLPVALLGVILLAGCSLPATGDQTPTDTESPTTSVQTATPTPTPTPIEGLPEKQELSQVNAHTRAGRWAFISITGAEPVGVIINGLWQGQAGALGNREYTEPAGGLPVDVNVAVPYYLSWSYVVLAGDGTAEPEPILLPNSKGNLFNVTSPFSDHDCPDYQPIEATGLGFLVTHCAVTISVDGAFPIGLAFAVPSQDKDYWFLDAPAASFI